MLCAFLKQAAAAAPAAVTVSKLVVKEPVFPRLAVGWLVQQRGYAARKGTRAKREKKKQKKEIVVEEFIPYKLKQELGNKPKASRRVNEDLKPVPVDDIYLMGCYKTKVFSVPEAIEAHREVHHRTMYNKPDANLIATIELDLRTDKKTRFLSLSRVVELPHPYQTEETKNVLAFVKTADLQKLAIEAGATKTGGVELVKSIQTGDVRTAEFRYVVAHENMVDDITPLRGLLKNKFPNTKAGSIGADIEGLVRRFLNGIEYATKSDVHEKDFGWVEVNLGSLSSPTEHLTGNLAAVLEDIHNARVRKGAHIVTRCLLWTAFSKEKFVIDHKTYTGDVQTSQKKGKVVKEIEEEVEDELVEARA